MNVIDLTHPVSPHTPVYPGMEQPLFMPAFSIDNDGFREMKMTLYSHTGTHVDAPAHLFKGAKTLDKFPLGHFYGTALVLHFDQVNNPVITVAQLMPYQDTIKEVEFLLIHTGWDLHWGSERYFSNYATLSLEAAQWLSGYSLKGFGVDTISVDTIDSRELQVHKVFLHNEIIIIENVAHLGKIPCSQFSFSCFPLNCEDADGSPVRAAAFVEAS